MLCNEELAREFDVKHPLRYRTKDDMAYYGKPRFPYVACGYEWNKDKSKFEWFSREIELNG